MKKSLILSILFSIGILSSVSLAIEPFADPSGMIQAPQANMNPEGLFSIGYNYGGLDITEKAKWESKYNRTYNNASLQMTLLPFLQVGGTSIVRNDFTNDFGGEAKVQLFGEGDWFPSVALGGNNLGIDKMESVYAVASKRIMPATVVSLGVGDGIYKSKSGGKMEDLQGLLAGVKQDFGPVALYAELSGSAINAGTSVQIGNNTNLNLGFNELQNLGADRSAPNNTVRVVFGLSLGEIFYNKNVFAEKYGNSNIYTAMHTPEVGISGFAKKPAVEPTVAEVPITETGAPQVEAQAPAVQSEEGLAAKTLPPEEMKQQQVKALETEVAAKQSGLYIVTVQAEKVKKGEKTSLLINKTKAITLTSMKESEYKGTSPAEFVISKKRADIIAHRINELTAADKLEPLKVGMMNNYYVGLSDQVLIFTITEEDTKTNAEGQKKLCDTWVERFNKAMTTK